MSATKTIRIYIVLLSALLLSCAGISTLAAEEVRTSTSVHFSKSQRDSGASGELSKDEHQALITAGKRDGDKHSSVSAARTDFWFYSADIILFNDHDDDGHFHGIDLLFDADTYYEFAEVYAVVYLSLDGGPWNEYTVTENFTLFGASAEDEYNIVTELVSGYPTGSYDLLIELFDGYNDQFLASYGPVDTPGLAFLPLEDANRDVPYVPPPPPSTTVVVHDHGGAFGWPSILVMLVGAGLLRKLRKKRT
ncbi:MAG: choice-of-anchor H family protein [Woeseiaceae bacterium]